MSHRVLTFLCAALIPVSLRAQPISNLVFTLGTTIQDAGLNNWSYVLLGASSPQILSGKRFAVYAKSGFPTNGGPFALRGTIFQQTDATSANTLLNQSVSLGDNLASLDSALNVLLRNVPGATNQPLAQEVVTALQVVAADPSFAPALTMLERLHPGLTLCAGQAFAEIIGGVTTYEVREVDPNTSVAGVVVGRVTITPGAPVVLPAPGYPFQVVTNAPSDHLRIRLRWGTTNELRRLSLLQFGFNVWRIPLASALAGNFDVTPPTPDQLHSNANFTLVNSYPVMATTDYAPLAGTGGPDDPNDLTTYFIADSNGRSPGNAHFPPGTTPPGYLTPAFNDGDQFYYFITARDVLGRDGLASAGGLATACRKNLPSAPTQLSVLNTVQFVPLGGGASTNQQHLMLRWFQNTNASDVVTQYWVYRWPNPAMALTNEAAPSNNLVGIVAQLPNTSLNFLVDTNADSPATPSPSNYWYTVRAVSQSACGSLLFSPNSAPASGVLRQRLAPAATTGELVGSCGTPVVMFQQFDALDNPNGPDTNNYNYQVTVTRRDAAIAWVQILAGNVSLLATQSFGPIYFPPDANSLSVNLALPASSGSSEFDVSCVAGTYYGVVSQPATCQTTNPPGLSQITEAVFNTGELLFTALSSSDPFLQAVNLNQSVCLPAVNPTRDASGTVHMIFSGGGGLPMLIQYSTNSSVTWTDLGIATPDTNNVYSIYLCPCLIASLPQLQGCTVNLPADGNCDQHVPRAGSSGAIAPIHVRFRLTPRTHEYRLYRSVDGGPPTLLAQAEALFDPNFPNNEIVRTDDAMPPSAARACYFVQTLDQNGNGSPLALIGCKDIVPPKPPRPVLSQPVAVGDTSNPQVALNWSSPTAGVYRFEIRIARVDQGGNGKPTGLFSPNLIKLTTFKPLQGLGSAFPQPRFLGLLSDRSLFSLFDEWQLTPPVGPAFGPGPQFSTTASIVPNVPYRISVAAEDIQGDWGDGSTEWTFVWKTPPTFPTVAWPARPLPPVTAFDEPGSVPQPFPGVYSPRVAAVLFTNYQGGLQDQHYPVGIRFASLPISGVFSSPNVGNTNLASYIVQSASLVDPNGGVFQRYSSGNGQLQNGQLALPMVVYRQQETNALFPRVSGNLSQVAPLLESVPWSAVNTGDIGLNASVTIGDRLIALGSEVFAPPPGPNSGADGYAFNFLYLRDQQPLVLGARYHYYVARFNTQHELAEIIDAGAITMPSN